MTGARTRRARRTALAGAALALAGLLAGCSADSAAAPPPGGAATTPLDEDLHALLPADLRASGVLRVGTDASYAPASSFAQDGRTIIGFEPDLLAAVGRVLGMDVELVAVPFDGLLEDVSAGRIDIAMSAMTDTPERQATADFVNYFSAGTSIVVRRGNPHGVLELGDLCGRRVAVERATVQVDLLSRAQARCGSSPIVVQELPDNAQALLELRTGRAAAVLSDYPPAAELANGERTRAYFQLASDTQYEPGLYGAAVAKDRPRLRHAVHGALERLMASGEYERVLRSWQVERGAVRQPSINAAAVR
jgi:polar amino acid transport system substrate-binding protein